MSDSEEVELAEAKMNAAKEALLSYIEKGRAIDRDHHRRLLARLKKAEHDFMRAISKFNQ